MHPRDGFLELKANKKGSSLVVTITIALWLLVEMFNRTCTGYDMNTFSAEDTSLLRTSVITVMIFFMVAISNWCFCTLLDGKGKLKDICDHTFEDHHNSFECMNKFRRVNMKYLREHATALQNSGQGLDGFYQFDPIDGEKWTPFAAIILKSQTLNSRKTV